MPTPALGSAAKAAPAESGWGDSEAEPVLELELDTKPSTPAKTVTLSNNITQSLTANVIAQSQPPKPLWKRQGTVTSGAEQQVEQRVYLQYLSRELETESACLELPYTLVVLISFSCLAIGHLNQQQVFAVEQAIEADIIENANFAFSHAFGHKGLHDVHSFADFWSWTRLGFIPLVVQPSWSYSEEYSSATGERFAAVGQNMTDPPSRWKFKVGGELPLPGDYMRYNRLVGGIRFRQELGDIGDDLCYFPPTASPEIWKRWYGKPCTPNNNELAFEPDASDTESFSQPERVEWMLVGVDSLEHMLSQAVDMEDGCQQMEAKGNRECLCKWCASQSPPQPWITEQTSRIEISMATYNPEYGLITLSSVNVFFNRGSFMHKRVELMSSWIDLWSTPTTFLIYLLVADAIWILSLLRVIVVEVQDIWKIVRTAKRRCLRALYDDYLGAWNVVDWISIFAAGQAIVTFLTLQSRQSVLNHEFKHLITANGDSSTTYLADVQDFFTALEEVCTQERLFRTSLCFYPMVVMLRLFKSFAAQPRMAVVTDTIKHGSQDLGHFFLIFLSVFCCLTLDAVLLFGQDLEEFATFFRALHSCFRLMFGDWDYKAMEQVGRISAAVWFWIFMFMIVMVMFNVLLAIIIETYTMVKKTAQNAESLFDTMQLMLRRRREYKAGKRVRLTDILHAIVKEQKSLGLNEEEIYDSGRLLCASQLCTLTHNLPHAQAARTLGNAQKAKDKELEEPLQLSEAHERLTHLNDIAGHMRGELFETFTTVDHYDTMAFREDAQLHQLAEQRAAKDASIAADLAKASSNESAVSREVLEGVTSEVGRLTSEVASVLAQTMKKTDKKQNHLEVRQKEMLGSIREMQTKLQMIQSEASGLTTRLQRYQHQSNISRTTVDTLRRGLAGAVIPSCLGFAPSKPPAEST